MSWGRECKIIRVSSLANGDLLTVYLCVQVVRCTPILYDNELLDISSLNGAVGEEYSQRLGIAQ